MNFDITTYAKAIETAIKAGGKIWDHEDLLEFKAKLKEYYRDQQGEQCCYCRKNSHGEFKMVLDIEHILPKSKFKHYMFHTYNLSISCKRCNMSIKNEDVSFVTDMDVALKDGNNSNLYRFVHPNLDDYFSHLKYFTKTVNQQKIIKYKVVADSSKGKFTYDYFKLSELEIDTINVAQGVKKAEPLSDAINPAIAQRIEELLKK
ncbi:MAG: hypothetical protein JWO09_2659 [Bacteroidetes bacterium]|nr:hypothetical protein [Bacteroidota bacterium]